MVAKVDEHWDEIPCAFVHLKKDAVATTEQDIIDHCRAIMAHFKEPRILIFRKLPKTSTDKVQKFKLWEIATPLDTPPQRS